MRKSPCAVSLLAAAAMLLAQQQTGVDSFSTTANSCLAVAQRVHYRHQRCGDQASSRRSQLAFASRPLDAEEENSSREGGGSTKTAKVAASSAAMFRHLASSALVAASIFAASAAGMPSAAIADEYGVEKEAPTLFTGESVMICKKRGPLGACLETVARTDENDNDKAKSYFRDPTTLIREKDEAMRAESGDGNSLIEKLRQQSIDNKEKNDLDVQIKTFENDQSANFGPFDRQVLIMNTDGKTFTLLTNPQAMRLKGDGYINGRKFVKQPTEEQIDAALEASEGDSAGGFLKGIFGGGGGGGDS